MASSWAILLSIAVVVVLNAEFGAAICKSNFKKWSPTYRRYVRLYLLNNVTSPGWISRNDKHLDLPRGTRFAFVCGACYSVWVEPSLELSATGTEVNFEPIFCNTNIQHRTSSDTDCLVSYGLTGPLDDNGELRCVMNRKGKLTTETVSYTVVDTETEIYPPEEIYANYNGYVEVSCPEIRVHEDNKVSVWHYPDGGNDIVTNTLRSRVVLKGREESYEVVCSTYDIYNPRKVWRKSYTIHRRDDPRNNYASTLNLDGRQTPPESLSLGKITTIAGVVVVLLLMTAVLIAVYRETMLSRRRRLNMVKVEKRAATNR